MKKDYKKLRNEILMKYGGNCAYCGINLIDKKFHIDHIEPIVRNIGKSGCENPENDNFENLNPSCPSCNIQKNSFTLEQFRSNIKSFLNSLNQYNTQYKFAKKYGLVVETDNDVKFYFEKINGL